MNLKRPYILLPVLFIVFIFVLSSLPVATIMAKINSTAFIRQLKADLRQFSPVSACTLKAVAQNGLHVPIFGILTILWLRFFKQQQIAYIKALFYTFLIVLFISHLDELYQFFLPERDASILDLFLDMLGFTVGVAIFHFISALKKEKSKKALINGF